MVSIEGTNPDVIWVIRELRIEDRASYSTSTMRTVYGLFACYRSEKPEPPKCFLAQIEARREDIAWPGPIFFKDGQLLEQTPRKTK